MKSILVIGLGRFGRHLSEKLIRLGNQVMVVDINEKLIEDLPDIYIDSSIGDCTNESVVSALGVSNFDLCFVTIGENFEASIIVTSLLKKYGAKFVCTKASREIQAEFLYKIGADEVVYPEKDMGDRMAKRFTANNVFDLIPLTGDYSIYEIPINRSWENKTVAELQVLRKHGINIVATKRNGQVSPLFSADFVFMPGDRIIAVGNSESIAKITAKA